MSNTSSRIKHAKYKIYEIQSLHFVKIIWKIDRFSVYTRIQTENAHKKFHANLSDGILKRSFFFVNLGLS